MTFVLECQIDNKPEFIQLMAWCQTGDMPLSEPMVAYVTDINSSFGLDGLTRTGKQEFFHQDFVNPYYATMITEMGLW